jgi:hypothetical protein
VSAPIARSALALGLALLASVAAAQEPRSGLVAGANVGGGLTLLGGSDYAPLGLLEAELTLGYEIPLLSGTVRPELSGSLGVVPYLYGNVRVGGSYLFSGMPVFVRVALDVSGVRGHLVPRWVLGGIGYELRLTDALAAFVEGDVGLPLRRAVGLPLLGRGGLLFRF